MARRVGLVAVDGTRDVGRFQCGGSWREEMEMPAA